MICVFFSDSCGDVRWLGTGLYYKPFFGAGVFFSVTTHIEKPPEASLKFHSSRNMWGNSLSTPSGFLVTHSPFEMAEIMAIYLCTELTVKFVAPVMWEARNFNKSSFVKDFLVLGGSPQDGCKWLVSPPFISAMKFGRLEGVPQPY